MLSTIVTLDTQAIDTSPVPDVIVSIEKDTYNISMEPGNRDRELKIEGNIICQIPDSIPDGVDCKVYLVPAINDLDPVGQTEFIFTKSITGRSFSFTMEIHEGYRIYRQLFTLRGHWHYEGGRGKGEINSSWCDVKIEKFGAVEISPGDSIPDILDLESGEGTELVFRLFNRGNYPDTIEVSVVSSHPGINLVLNKDEYELNGGEMGEVELSVDVDEDVGDLSTEIVLSAYTNTPGTHNNDSARVPLNVKTVSDEDLSYPDLTSVIVPLILLVMVSMLVGRKRSSRLG